MSELSGNRFVGVTWAGPEPAAIARLRELTGSWAIAEAPGALLCCERADCFASEGGGAVALGASRIVNRTAARAVDAASLLGRDIATRVAEFAPPLQLAWADGSRLSAATDAFGIGQIFIAEREGIAAFANTSTLLADLFAAPPDPATLTAFALFGAFSEDQTAFEGVRKLAAGTRATLADGRCQLTAADGAATAGGSIDETFVAAVRALAGALPEADLELSGGLDSRLILAAIEPGRRAEHRAITIGVPGTADVETARRVAAAQRLEQTVIDISGVAALDADALASLLDLCVRGYDHSANPIDKATLVHAGRVHASIARFGGQNGEIMRGFYYPAQPLDAMPDAALAKRLVRWRLEANDRVDPALLRPEVYDAYRNEAEQRMIGRLLSFGGPWSRALDRLYLEERMQRWVGNAAGNRVSGRISLYPFLDPGFVAAALALPGAAKVNSRAAYAMLARIDPALAAMPLDGGRTPLSLAGSPLRARVADLTTGVKKLVGRARRQLRGGTRTTLGSQAIGALWHRHRLFERLPVDRLQRTGLFDEAALDRLHRGEWLPDRPTLGFALMMAGLVSRGR